MSGNEYIYHYPDDDDMVDPLSDSRASGDFSRPTYSGDESNSVTPDPPRRTPVASPRKPPRPTSMAGAAPMNGDNGRNNDSIQMKDIRVPVYTNAPHYEVIDEPKAASPTWSEPPQSSSTPMSEPTTAVAASTPRSEPAPSNSTPRSHQPTTTTAASPTRSQPAKVKPSSRRYEQDRTSSTRSEQPRTSPTHSQQMDKEEFKRKKLGNKIKAAAEPEDDGDDYENSFLQRYKRPIMLVILFLLVALSIAVGIGARNASMVTFSGAFSSNQGKTCTHICKNGSKYPKPPLIVIALNGFKSSFFQHQSLVRNLARLAKCGVHGNTIPSYPSTAIPNLYSIVTGIYPAFHGDAGDWLTTYGMNESTFGPADSPSTYSRMDPRWFQDNALWGIAADQGLLTASHSWIGREGDIDENRPPSPSYYQTFHSGVNYKSRMKTVLNWLHLDTAERPQFITVYFEDPGVTAQQYGLESKQTMDSLAKVDSAIGLLLDALYEEQDLGCVNILVASTGGLAEKNCDRVYYLNEDLPHLSKYCLSPEMVTPVGRITATDQSPRELDTTDEILEQLQCRVDGGQAYGTRELPVQLHASYSLHKEDVVVLMDEGWTFARQPEGYNRDICKGASDGFNPFSQDMQGIFVGFGKSFKIGKKMTPVKNVDLYNLMAELIDVTPRDNNGTTGILSASLTSPNNQETVSMEFSSASNDKCSYPLDDAEYNQRQVDSETGCVCSLETLNSYPETTGLVLKDKDRNIDLVNVPNAVQFHAPFGVPKILGGVGSYGQNYCELYQSNFITAYEHKLKTTIFDSFTTRKNAARVVQIANCLRYDVRLLPAITPKCSSYDSSLNPQLPQNVVPAFLYDPSLANSIDNEFNALTSANIVPQYSAFHQGVWRPLAEKIRYWANQGNRSSEMNVVIGPVYDWDSNTQRDTYYSIAESIAWVADTPVPSHYFLVATRCTEDVSLRMCSVQSLEVISFVFPHTNNVKICKTFDDYLRTHLTSLQDLELITGLYLFQDIRADEETQYEFLQLKSQLPNMAPWMA